MRCIILLSLSLSLFAVDAAIASAESSHDHGDSRLLHGKEGRKRNRKHHNPVSSPWADFGGKSIGGRTTTHLCDEDGDGWFRASRHCDGFRVGNRATPDCNDKDPTRHPNATEVCGDGKDNNCNGEVDETCPFYGPRSVVDNATTDIVVDCSGTCVDTAVTCSNDMDCGGICTARTEAAGTTSPGPGGECFGNGDCPASKGKPSARGWCQFENKCIFDNCGRSMPPTGSIAPSSTPSDLPSEAPSIDPSSAPSDLPSASSSPSSVPSAMPSNEPSEQPSELPSASPEPSVDGSLMPSASPRPSDAPSTDPSMAPSLVLSEIPSRSSVPSSKPSNIPSDEPSLIPSEFPSKSSIPSSVPSSVPSQSSRPSIVPSTLPSSDPSERNECDPNPCQNGGVCTDGVNDFQCNCDSTNFVGETCEELRAQFMSGKHGIGFRIEGGISDITDNFNVSGFIQQLEDNFLQYANISYVILGISSGANGDRYLGPNRHLSDTIPGSVARNRDLFGEIVDALGLKNIDVIGYMAAQGPAMLKAGEVKAWDYPYRFATTSIQYSGFNNDGTVDAANSAAALSYSSRVELCANMTDVNGATTVNGTGICAPSVRKWVKFVEEQYNTTSADASFDDTLRRAYAELVVEPYAELYRQKLNFKGFWFDQGLFADQTAVVDAIRRQMPYAAIGWNQGTKIPLRNNNPGFEDFTFGHVDPIKNGPSNRCINYGMILSAEDSDNGFVYQGISPGSYASEDGEVDFTYTQDNYPSLAHVFMPVATKWNSGGRAWNNVTHAQEWMTRVMKAGGAFTWNIPRCSTPGASCPSPSWKLDTDDVTFLKSVYQGLDSVTEPYTFAGVC